MENSVRVQRTDRHPLDLRRFAFAHAERVGGTFPRGGMRRAWPLLVLATGIFSGCSTSTTSKPQVVSIAVTDAEGNAQTTPLTSLTVNTGVYLDVTLTNDSSGLGADWTVACGSAPSPGTPLPPGQTISTACGTFTPVHTLSAPVPNYVSQGAGYVTLYTAPAVPPQGGIVTLYAAAVADPSRFASLAFPIVGLPISIGFAPQPPASLAVNATAQLKAVVSNDYTPKGVTWSVICAANACGTLNPVQTASGVATTYTAPASAPSGGTVTVSATSVTDPTKSVSATVTIAPVAVSVAPATLSVATDGTSLLNATVTNDVGNAGVDWSLSCGAQGVCGSITAHTASGAASTYTAPSDVPNGGTVMVTAASTADKTATGIAVVTVTSTATPTVSGTVRGGTVPVAGASISLYVAGEAGYGSAAVLLNDKTSVITDSNGRFKVTSDISCPTTSSLLYAVARGGNAGGGMNPNLALMTALGPCNRVASNDAITIDEATTVTAAYAISAFTTDAAHVGAPQSNRAGLMNAFVTANEIVDISRGDIRTMTPMGGVMVPQREINTLANMLNRCIASAGGRAGDGSICGNLFSETRLFSAADTLQAVISIARNAVRRPIADRTGAQVFDLAEHDGPFEPSLSSSPDDWTLRLTFSDVGATSKFLAVAEQSAMSAAPDAITVDRSGNEWEINRDGTVTETVGAAAPRLPQ